MSHSYLSGKPSRIGSRLAAAIALATLVGALVPRSASASTCTWTGSSSTAWKTAGNWTGSGCTFPDTGDTAVINSAANQPAIALADSIALSGLTLNASTTVTVNGSLTLNGDSGGAGNLNVSGTGTLVWNSGTMSGTGTTTIASGGTVTLSSSGASMDARTFNNSGTVTQSVFASISLTDGATFNNQATGTYEIKNDQPLSAFGVPASAFSNAGTFKRTTSVNAVTISVPFTNSGTVTATTGTLAFSAAGTFTHSGSFTATGAKLRITNGTHTFNGNLTGTNFEFAGGTLTINSTYNATGTTTVSGATTTFAAASTITSLGTTLDLTAGTMNLNSGSGHTITNVIVEGGTLAGSDNVTSSNVTWSSGTVTGTGLFTIPSGTLTINSSGMTVDGRTVNNAGAATQSSFASLSLSNGAVFNNQAAGTYEIQDDQGINGFGIPAPAFNNAGGFSRTTSSNNATVGVPFTNSGTVTVSTGTLTFGSAATVTHSGTFTATGAKLKINNGTQTFNGNLTGTNFEFQGGTLTINSTYNATGTTINSGATTTFPVASTITSLGTTLDISGGTLNLNSGTPHTITNVTAEGGTLAGSDSITSSNVTWSSGTLTGTGLFTIPSGTLTLTSSGMTVDGRTVNNAGAATQSSFASLSLSNGAIFNNQAAGTYEIQNDQGINGFGVPAPAFNNAGGFSRTTSTNNASVGAPFTNSGTVSVSSGTLTLSSNATVTHSGTFTATGAKLKISNGTQTFNGNFTGTTFEFSGGTLTINSTYNATGTTINSGATTTFTNPSTITSLGTTLDVTGGTLNLNSGAPLTIANVIVEGGALSGSDNVTSSNVSLTSGTVTGSGSFTVPSGTLAISGSGITIDGRTVNNAGAATMSGSFTTMTIENSGGTFNNQAAGTFDFRSDGNISGFSGGTFSNAGTFSRTTSAGTGSVGVPFTNTGTVNAQSGVLRFNGTFTQTAGATHMNGGNLNTSSGTMNIQGGIFDGNGLVTGNISVSGTGQFNPGTSPGEISITGTYSQAAPGVLNVDVDGTSAGFDYDDILITGAANLGGTLNVSLGYTPAPGDSFTILKHGSRTGTFGTLNFPSPGAGLGWDIAYTDTTTKLTIAQLAGAFLKVDDRVGSGTISDHNGVLEPGERVVVEPSWLNMTESAITATGTASNAGGPAGPTYTLNDTSADYGTANANTTANCFDQTGNCYQFEVSAPATRPATHWDANFKETVTGGAVKTWKVHIGDSFLDVPRSQPFYAKIEALFHAGITTGCTTTTYCPGDPVSRGAMAIFIAKGIAGGGPNVPVSGSLLGKPYNCVSGGTSQFTDVLPTDIFCKHVHYIAVQNVTLGCAAGKYCPAGTVTRLEMAAFIAKATVAPGGGAAVPLSYGPDPVTGLSYNCNTFGTNIHFTDVPATNSFCKHVHFLWARGIIAGCSPTTYCPGDNVTRDAMAKFLSNAFTLLLYGPQ